MPMQAEYEEEKALLSLKDYIPYSLNKTAWMNLEMAASKTVTAVVDGGNAEIFKTPKAALHRVRTANVFLQSNRIISARQREGYVMAKASVTQTGNIECEANVIDSNLDFTPLPTLRSQDPCTLAEMSRRMLEIAASKAAVKELSSHSCGKLLVIDGTLETKTELEREEMEELKKIAAEACVTIAAVAKTCSLLTNKGNALIPAVGRLSAKAGYIAVGEGTEENHRAVIAIARLNEASQYLFRIEAENEDLLKTVVQELAGQSNDLAFPGYPYGLVMADRLARVSNEEAEVIKAKLLATAGKEIRELIEQSKALDAHGILDRI